ncbi:MAG TPA: polysaccharide deacetylase family protein [Candidatus Paceibacterota bacterium]|nr:polysaccharide deacetylase family protein [Candidatus Paceibacterota bacterium]
MKPGFGRIQNTFKGEAYWATHLLKQSDLSFWVKDRSGFVITDVIGGNNVNILTPAYRRGVLGYVSGNKTRDCEQLFDGRDYTIYFKLKQNLNKTGNVFMFEFGNYSSAGEIGFAYYVLTQALNLGVSDGTHFQQSLILAGVDTNLKGIGEIEFFIHIDATAKELRFRCFKSGVSFGNNVTVNAATWNFAAGNNSYPLRLTCDFVSISDLKKFTGIKTITECRSESYVTNLQFYYPDIVSGIDVSGNANHLLNAEIVNSDNNLQYYDNMNKYCLDHGYTLYKKQGKVDIYVPNDLNGNEIVNTYTGYRREKNFTGSLTKINLTDCLLEFTGNQFDRSNTTIYSNLARGTNTFYDVNHPKRWHINEIGRIPIMNVCNDGHEGKLFSKFANNSSDDRQYLSELFYYSTNKTGNSLNRVLRYCNDLVVSKTFTKGQLVLTWDDFRVTQVTTLFPILKQKKIKATFYVITTNSYVDSPPKGWYDLYVNGMDIECHSSTHPDLRTLDAAGIDAQYEAVNLAFTNRGIKLPRHTAYPGGANNELVQTETAKYRETGRKVSSSGDQPFNPRDVGLNKYSLPGYDIDQLDETRLNTLKGYMDDCRLNNKALILFGHDISDTPGINVVSIANITAIIDYAQSIGMEIVTIEELSTIMHN